MESFYPKYSGIIILNKYDFIFKKKKIYMLNEEYKNKIGLIVFYKKKCKHCISSKNKWLNIASMFKYKFPIGAIDCDTIFGNDLKIELNIKFVPNIQYVSKNGTISKFKEDTEEDDLIFYIYNKIN